MTDAKPAEAPVLDADGLPVPDPDFAAKQKAAFMAYFSGESDTEPTMFGADPGHYRDLSAKIPGLLVHSAGGACPFQSEGTLNGLPYYFRYRSGGASLSILEPVGDGEGADLLTPLYVAGMAYGHELDGVLSRNEFTTLMCTLVPQLEQAAFLWEFAGVKVEVQDLANPAGRNPLARPRRGERPGNRPKVERKEPDLRFTATDAPEIYRSRGATPQEAYERLFEVSAFLLSHGWSEEAQRINNALKQVDPTPLNTDYRAFPIPRPVFEVRP